ncbi:hypothetical protein KIN20_030057 [Parelaphostrongylus tenuis]|uniref:Uncharacterized protein n=1 Tax=Parelaphostrongylus tenuis TaxID=148309 RepID=A0AAD5WG29_PARTN|nr:hypothetical protein KIN20_030057 [Parelaphostrongylus tenuis]
MDEEERKNVVSLLMWSQGNEGLDDKINPSNEIGPMTGLMYTAKHLKLLHCTKS